MSLEGWKTFFEIGGVILLFLAFVFGAGVVLTGTRINALQAEQVRLFNIKLVTQQERAAKAEQDAAEAKTTAAKSNERTLALETDAANAKAAQQRVEIELAIQRERAAKAERDLQELQPRVLSEAQQKTLAAALLKIPKIPVAVGCVLSDGDGCHFAEQIRQVFVSCGWDVGRSISQAMYEDNPTGLVLYIPKVNPNAPPNLNDVPPSAFAIHEAFSSIGLLPKSEFTPRIPVGSVEILVGLRPKKRQ